MRAVLEIGNDELNIHLLELVEHRPIDVPLLPEQ